jgi:hypothetical protein
MIVSLEEIKALEQATFTAFGSPKPGTEHTDVPVWLLRKIISELKLKRSNGKNYQERSTLP